MSERYAQALVAFKAAIPSFEDAILRVATLPQKQRLIFTLKNYEGHVFRLHNRPKLCPFAVVGNIDELKIFCTALNIGWRLCQDHWTGLQMLVDYFADDTLPEDIKRLDKETLGVLKEIALHVKWPNNPLWGPSLSSQAKRVILSYNQLKSGKKMAQDNYCLLPHDGPDDFFSFSERCHKRICEGVNCLQLEPDGVKFPHCGKCKNAFYHSKECQKSAWKAGHKMVCGK